MGWEADWKKWTHTTYGIIQAIHICSKLDGGNLATLEKAISAAVDSSKSELGFLSSAKRLSVRSNSIRFDENDVPALLAALSSSTTEMLLVGTVTIVEALLSDLLVARRVVTIPPKNISGALQSITKRLKLVENYKKHQWAVEAMHEMRILRNVLVHASGAWTQRNVDDFKKNLKNRQPPDIDKKVSIGIGDLFAYRRAARTVLNAAARI